MPTLVLEFLLASPEVADDLLREFSLHEDATASLRLDDERRTVLVVTTVDLASAAWDVRATVRSFDERATELGSRS